TQKQIDKTIEALRGVQHVDARRYISYIAKNYQVIMINEAHNKPVHRAFVISLLGDLYKKGFRYLAMEMLNNFPDRSLDTLNSSTGYYTSEPIGGELVRIALQMGYKLVSYEDTASFNHTATQRDSVQAENIYNVFRKDPSAKMLVLAGYAHISKHVLENYIPMAVAFQRLSGINPLTIDQTDMTEGSNFEYGRLLYQAYTHKFPISTPSIALINNEPVNITNNENYDLAVIHPPASYRDGRPDWLTLDGLRKVFYIKPPDKKSFLAQAYYRDEVGEKGPDQNVPADQTYIPTNVQNYLLYLQKGKYIIVFRDMNYKILGKQNVEVN
ncbi:MAG: hypothetical protein JST96_12705, partial [Bacteroidetes bacterium]|nr:hypothetical protein [Bacteroidota bacterium]